MKESIMSYRKEAYRKSLRNFKRGFLCFSPRVENLEPRDLLAADFVPGELLIQFEPGYQPTFSDEVSSSYTVSETIHTMAMKEFDVGIMQVVKLPENADVLAAARHYSQQPNIVYAEPNWIFSQNAISNDARYVDGSLWGMESDDSPINVGPSGTTSLFGSQAEEAWNSGSIGSRGIVVGIVDTGIDFNHPDLAANIWVNPGEIAGNGLDDDGNGYKDDIRGWDFVNNNNSIYDSSLDDLHGTHVAGTIGAVGGNSIGVAGVNWNVTMISAKCFDESDSSGSILSLVRAFDYLTDLKMNRNVNIRVSNHSWSGSFFSFSLQDAILRHAKAGILIVAAAGNGGTDQIGDSNDFFPQYPASSSTLSNGATETAASYEAVISVAAIDLSGALTSFSNFGVDSVDIGAPGQSVLSTMPSGLYGVLAGTSMATPHVTGAVALYASKFPNATPQQIRSALLNSATATSSLVGKTATGGRLNVSAALSGNTQPPPTTGLPRDTVGLLDPDTYTWYLNNYLDGTLNPTEFQTPIVPTWWIPITGDWDGNGTDTVGLYDPYAYTWYLNNNPDGSLSSLIIFTTPAVPYWWIPITGDWNGDGRDSVGLYDPYGCRWYLNNRIDGSITELVSFQTPWVPSYWRPVAGDWDGNGRDSVGLYDPWNYRWYLNNRIDGSISDLIVFQTPPVPYYWIPLIGDWNNDNKDSVGLYDQYNSVFYLNNRTDGSTSELLILDVPFDLPPTWKPIAGNWDASSLSNSFSNSFETNLATSSQDNPTSLQMAQGRPTVPATLDRLARKEDVNQDGLLTPIDVLQVINAINDYAKYRDIEDELAVEASIPFDPRADVDGNGILSPQDALLVINTYWALVNPNSLDVLDEIPIDELFHSLEPHPTRWRDDNQL
jgi:thermitase